MKWNTCTWPNIRLSLAIFIVYVKLINVKASKKRPKHIKLRRPIDLKLMPNIAGPASIM